MSERTHVIMDGRTNLVPPQDSVINLEGKNVRVINIQNITRIFEDTFIIKNKGKYFSFPSSGSFGPFYILEIENAE